MDRTWRDSKRWFDMLTAQNASLLTRDIRSKTVLFWFQWHVYRIWHSKPSKYLINQLFQIKRSCHVLYLLFPNPRKVWQIAIPHSVCPSISWIPSLIMCIPLWKRWIIALKWSLLSLSKTICFEIILLLIYCVRVILEINSYNWFLCILWSKGYSFPLSLWGKSSSWL